MANKISPPIKNVLRLINTAETITDNPDHSIGTVFFFVEMYEVFRAFQTLTSIFVNQLK